MIGGDQAAGAGHVFDDDAGIAGNVLAHMARERAGVGVKTAAGGKTDDDSDRSCL